MSHRDAKNMKKARKIKNMGSQSPFFPFLGLFCCFLRLLVAEIVKNYGNPIEQTVAGYDPHVVAWQWSFPATIVYSWAVGRA